MIVWQLSRWQGRGTCEEMIRSEADRFDNILNMVRRRYKNHNHICYCVVRIPIPGEMIPDNYKLTIDRSDLVAVENIGKGKTLPPPR